MKDHKKPNLLYKFFWWFSGAHIPFIEPYPTEYNKFLHIGLTIFLTWVFATMSGMVIFGNIINTSDNIISGISNEYVIIFSGFFWGLIILNIDRYIAVTIQKKGNLNKELFFTEKIGSFFNEILPVVPRLFIALILSLLISTPLKLYLFNDTIKVQLEKKSIKAIEERNILVDAQYKEDIEYHNKKIKEKKEEIKEEIKAYNASDEKINKELDRYKSELEEINNKLDSSQKDIIDEVEGKSKTQKIGCGDTCKRKEEALEEQKRNRKPTIDSLTNLIAKRTEDLKALTNSHSINIQRINKEISSYTSNMKQLEENKKKMKEENGEEINRDTLIRKLEALFDLLKDENNKTLKYIYIILVSFIIILETAPVLFKLLAARGPYDAHYELAVSQQILKNDNEKNNL